MTSRTSSRVRTPPQPSEDAHEPDIVNVFVRLDRGEIDEDQADRELRDIRRKKSKGFFRFIESLS